MSKTLLHTTDAIGPAILRWTLAVVLFPHGAQKLLGWFGGHGFQGTMGYLTDGIGLPWVIALLVIVIEFFGPLGLALGLLSRPAAFGIASVMVGAVATTHWPHGFFMNWAGNQAGEGFEYHLLVLGIALALMIEGGGAFSLDRRLSR
jgi:putative oxidoreductase